MVSYMQCNITQNYKNSKILSFIATWMSLQDVTLREISQGQKDNYNMLSHWNAGKVISWKQQVERWLLDSEKGRQKKIMEAQLLKWVQECSQIGRILMFCIAQQCDKWETINYIPQNSYQSEFQTYSQERNDN